MRFLSADTLRANDARMTDECHVYGRELMERAGAALARWAERLCKLRGGNNVLLVAGRGQNGGDIFVAARHLCHNGFRVTVRMICQPAELKGDASAAWSEMGDVSCAVWDESRAWHGMGLATTPAPCVVVDGLLGTGAKDAPNELFSAAIDFVNAQSCHALVLAADVPSGMIADSGETPGACVRADVTLAFAAPKRGFINDVARPWLGHVAVADIGIPPPWQVERGLEEDDLVLNAAPSLSPLLPRRRFDAHKGSFGSLLVIGGSNAYVGAPILAAHAALAAGAGLVTLSAPVAALDACHARLPEVIAAAPGERLAFDKFSAIVIGPGLGATDATRDRVARVLALTQCPVVLDADALNVLVGVELVRPERLILTPHPGEASRLLDMTTAEIARNRPSAARVLASRHDCAAVLKGAGSLVARADGALALNLTGNPGMATAGSGDVLAGVAGAMLCHGLNPWHAARLATWLHGAAGDCAAWRIGEEGVTAGAIVEHLPEAFCLLRSEGSTGF